MKLKVLAFFCRYMLCELCDTKIRFKSGCQIFVVRLENKKKNAIQLLLLQCV